MSKLIRAAVLGGLVVFAAPLLAQAEAPRKAAKERQFQMVRAIREQCEASWSSKDRQKDCFDKQMKANDDVGVMFGTYRAGSEERFLLVDCLERWVRPEKGRVDYRLALQCAEFEIGKYQSRK